MSENITINDRPLTSAERLAAGLKRHGVELVFGQSLPSALILACEDLGIRQIVYRTENAAGTMADGFARISNRIAVVTAQNGPAATLLVPPLAEAMKVSVPVIALVQEVNRGQVDRNAFQELDHFGLFQSCTKWVRRVDDASRIEDYLDMAITAATTGRPGPAVLLLPADLLSEKGAGAPFPRATTLGDWPLDRTVADESQILEAARLLTTAERPLVIAGGGVNASRAQDLLARLQDVASLPVGYTMMGKGAVADTHPLTIGLLGNAMGALSLGRHMRPLVAEADVIFLIGNRTNQNGTDSWTLFPPNTRIIHLDIDGSEIGRTYEAAVRLVGDARATLERLETVLAGIDLDKRTALRPLVEKRIADAKAAFNLTVAPVRTSSASPIRPERLMAELDALLTPDTIVAADASYSSVWISSYLQARKPGMRFLSPRGLAGLGWGYPLALGAKLAAPSSPVICIVGDGGFGHVWSELDTARRMKIAVPVIVLNNGVLGFQKDAELMKFGRYTSACHFADVDHAAVARACQVPSYRVDRAEQLKSVLAEALALDTPSLIEIITDPGAYPPLTMFDGKL